MVAWGTLGLKSAFKLLCRAMDIDVDIANEVSKLITTYEFDKKHNEHVKIEDYISNPKHLELIEYSKKYMGIVDNMSSHPCFVAGTQVLTDNGYKNIEDVKIGDFVKTHTGNYERVYNTMINKEHTEILDIYSGSQKMSSTSNHPHLVFDGKEIKWLESSKITKGMYLCQHILGKKINNNILHKDNYQLTKVTRIEKNNNQLQPVFNISVENDESYTANNFVTHNCATILSNEDIRRKFGVLKSPNGVMVANVTGKQAEKLGYLKNDFLIVDVVDLNDKLYKRVGMEFVGANELYNLVEQNPELWSLFANGYTLCLNQMESAGTTAKMMKYKPSNLWELSNSISAIRPSSASIYAKYEKREHFDYGIPFIDNLLQGEFIDNSFMVYQEQQMILLAIIGIKPDKIVSVIKAISKKQKAVIDSIGEEFHKKLFDLCIKHGETDEAKVASVVGQLWTVFVDSAEYGFNAPHAQATATDCLHTALIKHLFPIEFYEVALEKYSLDKKTEKVALLKNEAFRYKGITVKHMRYGQDNRKFTANNEKNEIYQSLLGVKALNYQTAETIYNLSKEYPIVESFYELYIKMTEAKLTKTHIENLIKIGYFDDIAGTKNEKLWLSGNFKTINKKQLSKDKIQKLYSDINPTITLSEFYESLKDLAIKDTDKTLKFNDGDLAKYLSGIIRFEDENKLEELYWECSLLGTTVEDVEESFMLGRIMKYNPSRNSIVFKHIRTGVEQWIKVKSNMQVKEKDYIFVSEISSNIYRGREYFTIENMVNLSQCFGRKSVDKD